MKLLFVVADDWYFLSHRLPLALAALREGFEVVVATRVGAQGQQIINAGLSLIPLEHLKREKRSPLNELRAISELRGIYRREQPDIVHHVALKPVLYGNIAALGLPLKIVNAFAGLGYLASSKSPKAMILRTAIWNTMRYLLNRPNAFTILQNFEDRDFAVNTLGMSEENTEVIMGSGVDLELFKPSQQPSGVPIVMLPSRLLWNKGVAEFVAAAELLTSTGVKARFVIVGDTDEGSPSAIPRSQIAAWNDSDSIEWWGKMSDMQNVLPQASIICLPSYREGIPKVLIEAAACGRPIVTTDVPGCRDVVQHYVNGMLVPARNSDDLALTIKVLLGNTDLRTRMGDAGRKIAAHFSQDVVIEKTLVRYGLLTNARRVHQ
ncbi:MAG TPA: glycosyltransferase family 4 protein [Candidatus Angelobacter sp.]